MEVVSMTAVPFRRIGSASTAVRLKPSEMIGRTRRRRYETERLGKTAAVDGRVVEVGGRASALPGGRVTTEPGRSGFMKA